MALLLFAGGLSAAVPLENWRFPFFRLASDFELSQGSRSRMFWDGIGSAALFHESLFRSGDSPQRNCWMIEPAVTCGYVRPVDHAPVHVHGYWAHGDLCSSLRYRRLYAWHSLDVDSRYPSDPWYPAHRDRAVRGRIEEAALQLDWSNGLVRIGRQKRNWGPFPDRSLLLSSNPYSYDAAEFGIWGSFFEFRHLFAPFSSKSSSRESASSWDRYLTAHSLNLVLGRWITVGFTETVLFTRDRGFPDMQYVNPVSIYSVVNTNQEGNGNLMLGFQWNIHPLTESVSLRGQLLLDDFQVDNEMETDREPAHWAIDAGIFWKDPLRVPLRHLLSFEVTHASEWVYTVTDENTRAGERYMYGMKSLGLPFNDGTRLVAGAFVVPKNLWASGVFVSYESKGGNTELSSWHDSEPGNVDGLPVSEGRPVQRRFAFGGEGYLYAMDYVHLYGRGDLGWIRNKDNTATGSYRFDPGFSLELSVHFSGLTIGLP